jgi:PAS domain S-box-containing protein
MDVGLSKRNVLMLSTTAFCIVLTCASSLVATINHSHNLGPYQAVAGIGSLFSIFFILITARIFRQELKLRRSVEVDLKHFFGVSLDILTVASLEGKFTRMNPASKSILGWTPEEMCSRPVFDFIHPDDIQPTLEAIERQSKGETILSFENRYRCKDGSYKWLSWKSVPYNHVMYGAARDITEIKEREQRLHNEKYYLREALAEKRREEEAALAASRLKSEFLANMSHEIRTPINGILGMAQLLEDTALTTQQREYRKDITRSAESLLDIINDILDFSKIEAGKFEIDLVDFDLEREISDIRRMMFYSAQEKGLNFIIRSTDVSHCFYQGDSGKLRQIILNLLSNAIKFTEKGDVVLRISEEVIDDEISEIQVEIIDTGIGIPFSRLPKLFKPFSQIDSSTSRRFGGSGLGLSICKHLVELMGGRIGVNSIEGKGSRFWFCLPLKRAQAVSQKEETAQVKPEVIASKGVKILVAEDNLINQKIIAGLLENLGYEVSVVENGREVLEAVEEQSFAAIFMDCQMPELDGYETTAALREREGSQGLAPIPIVALTASAIKGDRERCLAVGMNDYIAKPVKKADLITVLLRWLDAPHAAA